MLYTCVAFMISRQYLHQENAGSVLLVPDEFTALEFIQSISLRFVEPLVSGGAVLSMIPVDHY